MKTFNIDTFGPWNKAAFRGNTALAGYFKGNAKFIGNGWSK